ncbi:MAG: EutN/CcmL family microcompartment protein [Rhodothermales bacterium]|nr:EutN/CcmL family microcompartment protein [Rhodothermales bacterium]
MNLGRVIGSVWATRKYASLQSRRLLLVQPMTFAGEDTGSPIVSLDTVDAGPGDVVLYATSSEAAIPFRPSVPLTPTDATIVGIAERIDHQGRTWLRGQEAVDEG